MKILLVEDDFDLSGVLSQSLLARGYDVLCCADGAEALMLLRKRVFDIAVLDLTLPTLDGLELLQRLRSGGNRTPVLVLTARGAVEERVMGLKVGADDYLAKPFDLEELVARLQSLTRRLGRDGELRCGLVRFDTTSGAFYAQSCPLDLSPREAMLMTALMTSVDRVVPKESLRLAVFGGDEAIGVDAIEVLVHRLRKRLAGTRTEIMNLRGVGYLIRDDLGAASSTTKAV